MEITNINKSMKRYYPVSDESIAQLSSHFKIHNFPAKYLFIRGGFIDRNVRADALQSFFTGIYFITRRIPVCSK